MRCIKRFMENDKMKWLSIKEQIIGKPEDVIKLTHARSCDKNDQKDNSQE